MKHLDITKLKGETKLIIQSLIHTAESESNSHLIITASDANNLLRYIDNLHGTIADDRNRAVKYRSM